MSYAERRYCLIGDVSGQRITWGGRVITHTDRAEMEFLFPKLKVVPVTIRPEDAIPLQFVPGMEGIKFPLDRRQFR